MNDLVKNLVWIDDEPGTIKYYIRAVRDKDCNVIEIPSADEAWEFFEVPHPEICAVVLDIMMPPGKHMEKMDHEDGLKTGVILYERILAQQAILDLLHERLPVAVLTNASNPTTLWLLEKARERHKVKELLRIWPKMDTSPMAFADQFDRWLRELGKVK